MNHIYLTLLVIVGSWIPLCAQNATDGWMMDKGSICALLQYDHRNWTQYWEGATLRTNENIGHFQSHQVTAGITAGIHKRFNLIAMLPYITNTTSVGIVHNQNNFQDLSLFAKGTPVQVLWDNNEFKIHAVGGFSTPVSGYYPDYMPLSIGFHSTNASLRGIAHYWQTRTGIFATAEAAYTLRSNIKISRDYYYTDRPYYTNIVDMEDVATWSVTAGVQKPNFKIQGYYNVFNTLEGEDIRTYDMPFPSYRYISSTVGGDITYRPNFVPGLAAMVGGNYVVSGRNVGKAWGVTAGVTYEFQLWNKEGGKTVRPKAASTIPSEKPAKENK